MSLIVILGYFGFDGSRGFYSARKVVSAAGRLTGKA
jgi:hypothetical protein